MTESEKIIDEMAKCLCGFAGTEECKSQRKEYCYFAEKECYIFDECKLLVYAGYRKMSEDRRDIDRAVKKARKETAIDILSRLYKFATADNILGLPNKFKGYLKAGIIEVMAEEYGVEVQE